jgi:hypothetical protein
MAAPATVGEAVAKPGAFAAIQIARLVVRLVATAFHKDCVNALRFQFEGHRYAGDATADDHDRRGQLDTLVECPGVNDHGAVQLCWRYRLSYTASKRSPLVLKGQISVCFQRKYL